MYPNLLQTGQICADCTETLHLSSPSMAAYGLDHLAIEQKELKR
jgi:hypothetical protein